MFLPTLSDRLTCWHDVMPIGSTNYADVIVLRLALKAAVSVSASCLQRAILLATKQYMYGSLLSIQLLKTHQLPTLARSLSLSP